jgi:PKD repeat protein
LERIMRSFGTTFIGLLALAMSAASCTVKDTEAPSLSGPSEMALSLAVAASPDLIYQDGSDQSSITITARGPNSQPARGVNLRVDMMVGGMMADFGRLSARTVTTGDDGVARLTYTSPPAVPNLDAGTVVTLLVTPLGTDYRNSIERQVDIRVIPKGVILPPNGAPQPAFSFSPTEPLAFQTIFFDASGTRDEGVECGSRCSYTWSFGDGGSASGINVSHDYRAAGTYSVTLRVTDDRGQSAQTSQAVAVAGGTPPTASFVFSPTAPVRSQQIFFNAAASTAGPGRRIISYEWDFGSGRTATGLTVAKQYDNPGSYVVTLTVVDDAFQQGTVSQTVTVIP